MAAFQVSINGRFWVSTEACGADEGFAERAGAPGDENGFVVQHGGSGAHLIVIRIIRARARGHDKLRASPYSAVSCQGNRIIVPRWHQAMFGVRD